MKKALSLFLALSLCFALSIPTFAAPTGNDAISVTVGGKSISEYRKEASLPVVEYDMNSSHIEHNTVGAITYIDSDAKITVRNSNPDYRLRVYVHPYVLNPNLNAVQTEWIDDEQVPYGTVENLSKVHTYIYNSISLSWAEEYGGYYLRNDGTWNTEDRSDFLTGSYQGDKAAESALILPNEFSFTLPNLGMDDYYHMYVEVEDVAADYRYWTMCFVRAESAGAAAPTSPRFSDVPANAYYADAVKWAIENGVTNGTSGNTFSPNDTCTTAQILTFLHRAKGTPAPTQGNPYSDVKQGDYFYNAALWARENGLTDGGSFNGGVPCTRAAVVTYLWKLAGKPSAGNAAFTDVPASADYAQAVAWAVAQGITNGTGDNTFSPDVACTRGQIVTFLYRAYAK